jgi:hypothetical protein
VKTDRLVPTELRSIDELRRLLAARSATPSGGTATTQVTDPSQSAKTAGGTPSGTPQVPWPLRSAVIQPFLSGAAGPSAGSRTNPVPTAQSHPRGTGSSRPSSQNVPYEATRTPGQRSSPVLLVLLTAFAVAMTAMVIGAGHRGRSDAS